MKDYHNLENEILGIFRLIFADENNKEEAKLIKIFQKYWKSYQDNWPSRYWDTYNLVFEDYYKSSDTEKNNNKETNESSKYNIKDNQFKINNFEEESIISLEKIKNGIEQQNEIEKEKNIEKSPFYIKNESILKNFSQQKIKRNKKNNKNKDRDLLINLNEIDKELDDLMEKSFTGLNVNDEKSKNSKSLKSCLDCKIF